MTQPDKMRKTSFLTRRGLLQRTAAVAAVAAPLGILAACSSSASSTAAAATPTSAIGALANLQPLADNKKFFNEIMTDEDTHVTFLLQALGTMARPKPTFHNLQQADVVSFANVAMALENTGVGAYLLAAPFIVSKSYLAAAGSILTIEARHAGFLDAVLNDALSSNGTFDKPLTQDAVVAAASPFISTLNNGKDPSKPLTSDIDILNFALLLEYLEKEFYDINVPMFFP